jgi:hypothetical protein
MVLAATKGPNEYKINRASFGSPSLSLPGQPEASFDQWQLGVMRTGSTGYLTYCPNQAGRWLQYSIASFCLFLCEQGHYRTPLATSQKPRHIYIYLPYLLSTR